MSRSQSSTNPSALIRHQMETLMRYQRKPLTPSKREQAQLIAAWKESRATDTKRKAEFIAALKFPYAVEYGEHKAKQGDIYAVVVHTERSRADSPFCVKYYIVKKAFGRLYAYECNANGEIVKKHGREIHGGKYKGYKKVA